MVEDNEIGSLDERWNGLEGWTSNHNMEIHLQHYTRGNNLWFDEWQDVMNLQKSGLMKEMNIFKKFKTELIFSIKFFILKILISKGNNIQRIIPRCFTILNSNNEMTA